MKNIINRIKLVEKKVLTEEIDLSHMCLIVDECEDGRQYYTDENGIRHEYIVESYEGKKPRILVILKDYQGGVRCQT